MEFTPVESSVADEAIATWREENYDTDVATGEDSSLFVIVDQLDSVLDSPLGGLEYGSVSDECQILGYSDEFIEPLDPPRTGVAMIVSLGIRYSRNKIPASDEYVIDIERTTPEGGHVCGTQYRILYTDNRTICMGVESSIDGMLAAAVGNNEFFEDEDEQFRDATEYDITQLFDELTYIFQLEQKSREATDET